MIENESAENYLETILVLSRKLPVVRSVDITVTDAGFIYLTDSGRHIAELIYERHEFVSEWLMRLGVAPDIAIEDACKIEHILSKESYDAIKTFVMQHTE